MREIRQRRHCAALASCLVLAALGAGAALPATASATIQLGAYTPGAPANAQALSEYASMVGRQPDIVMWYRDFPQPLLYSNEISNLRATGQAPMITWEPYEQSLSGIAAGAYDSYLRESAQIAKSWGGPLMIRFAHEMNGTWYPWAGSNTSPETFIAAWRHVVSIFRAEGAGNVKWVWSPNVQEGSKYPISPYFPGDEWVDYVGLDGYNWGSAEGRWQSLREVLASSYATVTQLSSRPVIVAETSSSETGGDKAAWIRNGFMSELPQSLPRVSAVIWFDKVQEQDWRINSSRASLDAYRAVVACSIYGGTGPCQPGTTESSRSGKKKLTVRSVRVPHRVGVRLTGAVSYDLSQAARVSIKVVPRGHLAGGVVRIRRSRAGHNEVPLVRLVRRRRLPVGRYRIVIVARSGGQRSAPHTAHFRVV